MKLWHVKNDSLFRYDNVQHRLYIAESHCSSNKNNEQAQKKKRKKLHSVVGK